MAPPAELAVTWATSAHTQIQEGWLSLNQQSHGQLGQPLPDTFQ